MQVEAETPGLEKDKGHQPASEETWRWGSVSICQYKKKKGGGEWAEKSKEARLFLIKWRFKTETVTKRKEKSQRGFCIAL